MNSDVVQTVLIPENGMLNVGSQLTSSTNPDVRESKLILLLQMRGSVRCQAAPHLATAKPDNPAKMHLAQLRAEYLDRLPGCREVNFDKEDMGDPLGSGTRYEQEQNRCPVFAVEAGLGDQCRNPMGLLISYTARCR
jgi:hypothetical protein